VAAVSQGRQLIDAVRVLRVLAAADRVERLERIFKGPPLPPTTRGGSSRSKPTALQDDPRNLLFELVAAAALRSAGFAGELPKDGAEDLRAEYPGLDPFVVECKRPATGEGIFRNVKRAREQLQKRRAPAAEHGLIMLGIDRLEGLATKHFATERQLAGAAEEHLVDVWRTMKRAVANAKVFPHAAVCGVHLTGPALLGDRGGIVTLSMVRMFFTGGDNAPVSKAIREKMQGTMEFDSHDP
jgi:hypothetical protein